MSLEEEELIELMMEVEEKHSSKEDKETKKEETSKTVKKKRSLKQNKVVKPGGLEVTTTPRASTSHRGRGPTTPLKVELKFPHPIQTQTTSFKG